MCRNLGDVGCNRSVASEGKGFELDDPGEADVLLQSVNFELKRAPQENPAKLKSG
ncbi:hypothetical protein HFO48_15740 [Rhizobium leguminosarum]|nr:hypothetical protein [Rhizobium leguminosarum]